MDRRTFLLALPALAACTMLPAHASRTPKMKIDKTGWKTHCFGRYLIDLPPDAGVTAKYKIWGKEIVLLRGYIPQTLKETIDKREAELKAQKHQSGSSLLVQAARYGNGSAILVYWEEPRDTILYRSETWFVAHDPYRVYRYRSNIDPDILPRALAFREKLSQSLRGRKDDEIPTVPGFCIDGGIITGSEFMDESFNVSVSFHKHPKVFFGFSGYVVGKPDKPLLERTGGMMNDLLGKFAGLKTLRRGKRNIGPIEAEEELTAGTEKGQTLYAFNWEAPGKANSLAFPNLNAELGLLEQTPPPPTPPFKDDTEALALWDAIIDSIRLRPGAV